MALGLGFGFGFGIRFGFGFGFGHGFCVALGSLVPDVGFGLVCSLGVDFGCGITAVSTSTKPSARPLNFVFQNCGPHHAFPLGRLSRSSSSSNSQPAQLSAFGFQHSAFNISPAPFWLVRLCLALVLGFGAGLGLYC